MSSSAFRLLPPLRQYAVPTVDALAPTPVFTYNSLASGAMNPFGTGWVTLYLQSVNGSTTSGSSAVVNNGTATSLTGHDGPDGLVLTSTILSDSKEFSVPGLQLDRLRIPVLVVHHVDDGCSHCRFADISKLMDKLGNSPKKELLPVKGGVSQGDPCEARSYHGFNGVEAEVVKKISAWMLDE